MGFRDSKEHKGRTISQEQEYHEHQNAFEEHRVAGDDEAYTYDQFNDLSCEDAGQIEAPHITISDLRSDRRLQHLLRLRKGFREHVLDDSWSERHRMYLLRKAEEKVRELARTNRRLSIKHEKGERRKTHRLGVGKCGSRLWWGLNYDDIDAALEHACATSSGNQVPLANSMVGLDGVQSKAWLPQDAYRFEPINALCDGWGTSMLDYEASRWEEGVARAKAIMLLYQPMQRHISLPEDLQRLVRLLEERGGPFEKFRVKFLKRYGRSLSASLKMSLKGQTLSLAPLAPEVQERFLAACGSHRMSKIVPAFHGTQPSKHESIFSRGLLVPGDGNEIRVANGSAHGNGVYVAKLNNPWLSVGFARSNQMMVCGVMDDAVDLRQPERIGSLNVTKRSGNVHHVGDAMVVFKSSCVAPLFVAEWESTLPRGSNPPQQVSKQQKQRYSSHSAVKYGAYTRVWWEWQLIKHKRAAWLRAYFGSRTMSCFTPEQRFIYNCVRRR